MEIKSEMLFKFTWKNHEDTTHRTANSKFLGFLQQKKFNTFCEFILSEKLKAFAFLWTQSTEKYFLNFT